MVLELPYPGYSWSFTQHAVGLDAGVLYDLLCCAAPFVGRSVDNIGPSITELMVKSGVLTPNMRDGKYDAWRDYQQILAELGLIYSTKVYPVLEFTELGRLYLGANIGFSELMNMQSLRYQYPNGYKHTIQARLRNLLPSQYRASNLIELQGASGVLIKPGILILRILIELARSGELPSLSTDQIQTFLLPCSKNSEWPIALDNIINNKVFTTKNGHARRNVQDWMKFLSKTDFIESDRSHIYLSHRANDDLRYLEDICESQENLLSFWIPQDYSIADRISWFGHFGSNNFEIQEALNFNITKDNQYIDENYPAGLDEGDIEDDAQDHPWEVESLINYNSLDYGSLGISGGFSFEIGNVDDFLERMKAGVQKRYAKTLLHDNLVKRLAQKFEAQGAELTADTNSVDLMAKWPDGSRAIFEVKTATRRTFPARLRLAVGQIQEYGYRLRTHNQIQAERVLVFNINVPRDCWQSKFVSEHLGIGLISVSERYEAVSPKGSVTAQYWT